MKFLLDQGLPRSTVGHLQALGHEAEHVGNLGMATATDEVILAEGKSRSAIVVTLDSDFHALLALSNASSPSVIRIRMQGLKGKNVATILEQVVEATEQELIAGAAVTVTDRRLALRRLPLITNQTEDPNDDANGS
jgi:predicted nuclease of predicted toxin-antitoxin system